MSLDLHQLFHLVIERLDSQSCEEELDQILDYLLNIYTHNSRALGWSRSDSCFGDQDSAHLLGRLLELFASNPRSQGCKVFSLLESMLDHLVRSCAGFVSALAILELTISVLMANNRECLQFPVKMRDFGTREILVRDLEHLDQLEEFLIRFICIGARSSALLMNRLVYSIGCLFRWYLNSRRYAPGLLALAHLCLETGILDDQIKHVISWYLSLIGNTPSVIKELGDLIKLVESAVESPFVNVDLIPWQRYLQDSQTRPHICQLLCAMAMSGLVLTEHMDTTLRILFQENQMEVARHLLRCWYRDRDRNLMEQAIRESCAELEHHNPAQLCNIECAMSVLVDDMNGNAKLHDLVSRYVETIRRLIQNRQFYTNQGLCMQIARLLPILSRVLVDSENDIMEQIRQDIFSEPQEIMKPTVDMLAIFEPTTSPASESSVAYLVEFVKDPDLAPTAWKLLCSIGRDQRNIPRLLPFLKGLVHMPNYLEHVLELFQSLFETPHTYCNHEFSELKSVVDTVFLKLPIQCQSKATRLLSMQCIDLCLLVNHSMLLQDPETRVEIGQILARYFSSPLSRHCLEVLERNEQTVVSLLLNFGSSKSLGEISFVQSLVIEMAIYCRNQMMRRLLVVVFQFLDSENPSIVNLALNTIGQIALNRGTTARDLLDNHSMELFIDASDRLISDSKLAAAWSRMYRTDSRLFLQAFSAKIVSGIVCNTPSGQVLPRLAKASQFFSRSLDELIVDSIEDIVAVYLVKHPSNDAIQILDSVLGGLANVKLAIRSCFSQIASKVFSLAMGQFGDVSISRHLESIFRESRSCQMNHFVFDSLLKIKQIISIQLSNRHSPIDAIDGLGFLVRLINYEIDNFQKPIWTVVQKSFDECSLHASIIRFLWELVNHHKLSNYYLLYVWFHVSKAMVSHPLASQLLDHVELDLKRSIQWYCLWRLIAGHSDNTDPSTCLEQIITVLQETMDGGQFLAAILEILTPLGISRSDTKPEMLERLRKELWRILWIYKDQQGRDLVLSRLINVLSRFSPHWDWQPWEPLSDEITYAGHVGRDKTVFRALVRFIIPLYKGELSFQNQDTVSFVIQELLKSVQGSEYFLTQFELLPRETRELVKPLFESKYRMNPTFLVHPLPYGRVQTWIESQSRELIDLVQDPETRRLFESMIHIIPLLSFEYADYLVIQILSHVLANHPESLDQVITRLVMTIQDSKESTYRSVSKVLGVMVSVIGNNLDGIVRYFSRLKEFPIQKLMQSAFSNGDFVTCIYFGELCGSPPDLQQRCECALGNVDQVLGYTSLKNGLYYQCKRDYESAIVLYSQTPSIAHVYRDLLQCYELRGSLDVAYHFVLYQSRTQTNDLLYEKAAEYSWQLSRWDDIDPELGTTQSFGYCVSLSMRLIHNRAETGIVQKLGLVVSTMNRSLVRELEFDSRENRYKLAIFGLTNLAYEDLSLGTNRLHIFSQTEPKIETQQCGKYFELWHKVQLFIFGELGGQKPLISLSLAKLYRKTGRYSLALDLLLRMAKNRGTLPGRIDHLLALEMSKLYWKKNSPSEAVEYLQRYIEQGLDGDKECVHRLYLTCARWMIDRKKGDVCQILPLFEKAIENQPESEKAYYHLSKFQQSLIDLVEPDQCDQELALQMMINMSKAIVHGKQHVCELLPRFLTIWQNLGYKPGPLFDRVTAICDDVICQLSPCKLFLCTSQLISRICHPNPKVFGVLKKILVLMLDHFPHQTLWSLASIFQSKVSIRTKRCNEILSQFKAKSPAARNMVRDMALLSNYMLKISNHTGPANRFQLSLQQDIPQSHRMFPLSIAIPTLDLLTGFTLENIPLVHSILDHVDVMPSLQRPKRIVLVGSDGKKYAFLCKSRDDLRKDARFMEIGTAINNLLAQNQESRRRNLGLRTYAVFPLNSECGLIQWVENTVSFRSIVMQLYKNKGLIVSNKQLKEMVSMRLPAREVFVRHLLPAHPPVFREWFFYTFSSPLEWHRARLAYARTCSVISVVGYIMGLGDRHGENILFDRSTGECIHVDFSCLFEKGLEFEKPERVPFRLTHNMVHGLGPTGYEGTFRMCSELTLEILREKKEVLAPVLETFVHDPLVEWNKPGGEQSCNARAHHMLATIDRKLSGLINKTSMLPLSKESQIEYLINEATSLDNLCEMYIGWGPFL